MEIFDGCFLDPETIGTSVVGVACTSSLELSMWVSDENRSDGLCDEGAEDECRTLMREFLTAVDEQDPDQNLAPEDEGRPEEIAAMGLGKNLLYRHDVCKAITSAGLEDDLAEQLGVAADDLTIYSTVYGHPRDEEVQGCDFYFEFDPAEDGAEHPLSLELAFSRSPVEPIVGDDVFPGCLLDGLRVVCGDHLVLRLVGGYVDDATDRIDDFPGLAHDVLVTLSKQGEI